MRGAHAAAGGALARVHQPGAAAHGGIGTVKRVNLVRPANLAHVGPCIRVEAGRALQLVFINIEHETLVDCDQPRISAPVAFDLARSCHRRDSRVESVALLLSQQIYA